MALPAASSGSASPARPSSARQAAELDLGLGEAQVGSARSPAEGDWGEWSVVGPR